MDMWSLGCIIYELYTRSSLLSSEQEANARLLEAYYTGDFDFPVHSVFEPKAWGKNNFILHTLGEGLISDNNEPISPAIIRYVSYMHHM